ncbi:UDP-N-acetylmuramoyl-L-alanine--D-glutamate ligase [Candidatus Parcubacteria bacterium]|nr:MAG: UDP-N-acetylmuramoyl-L-alanine--D-glutamate ligase [Candidatus Parcubacteria bacterium]
MVAMSWQAFFTGKRVTVMGLGLLGRAVGDAEFLALHCAEVTITDLKDKEALATSVARLTRYPNIRFVLGRHELSDFEGRDFILKAAGVPLESPHIAHARQHGIPVEMSTALFAAFAGIPIIGVTGTRGKSTTTHLIHHTLLQAGVRALLGGNVAGVSTLAHLPRAGEYEVAALELDSWQLQGFGERRLSPQLAVFTSFMEDHQNYYPSMERYFADKAHIFAHQNKDEGVLVASPQVIAAIGAYGYARQVPKRVVIAQPTEEVPPTPQLLGAYNRWNAAVAYHALRVWGLSYEDIQHGFASFRGVPGRLSLVREWEGVAFYNDTTATTPQAARAGIQALVERHKRVVAIMGGSDKRISEEEYAALADLIAREEVQVVLLEGSGTPRLARLLEERGAAAEGPYGSMDEAVSRARELARAGDAVVLSPAFASFGLFQNEFDRGEQFEREVRG